MYKIDIPKIIFIYGIILVLMYVFVIQGNIVKDVSKFTDKKENIYVNERTLDTDYISKDAAQIYLNYFLKNLSNLSESELSTYFDENYYTTYSSNIKKALSQKARIRDTKNNISNSELVSEKINEYGEKYFVFNVLVMKKGYKYPEGYEILHEEDSRDKGKNIDICVIEKAPYEFELQIPDKEFV